MPERRSLTVCDIVAIDKERTVIAAWRGQISTAMAAAIRAEEYRQRYPHAVRIIIDMAVTPISWETLPGQNAVRA